ncbi:MAG: dynamin family protein [Candidatus Binatia bacterium]
MQESDDDAVRRAYGVLATSLNEALNDIHQALTPHAALLPKGRLGDLDALLAEFARRRIRIAIYGEVKAGKSTLINALAGRELSPVAFDPLTSMPLRVTYGSRTVWQVGANRVESLAELAQMMRTGVRDATEVVVETEADLLRLGGQVDLVDTPGVGSDVRFDSVTAEALRSLDAVVVVVRYPALFTQATRALVQGLQSDIGKLFVVWNLDGACAELSAAERDRQAQTLRADVAGAHELHLVDARTAFRAQQSGDAAGLANAGLPDFAAAVGRFASSGKREVTALREAGKRAASWIEEAQTALGGRRRALETRLNEVRERLHLVERDAQAKTAEARSQLAEYEAAVAAAGQRREAAAAQSAETLHKAIRAARRAWVRSGQAPALESAVAAATAAFAETCGAAARTATEALRDAAKRFGASAAPAAAEPRNVRPAELAPAERIAQARTGHARLLRRVVWNRWYLPGLNALERVGVLHDLAAQAAWWDQVVQAAHRNARAVLDARLADIARRMQAEQERIRVETNFLAEEGEQQALSAHLPMLAAARERIEEIGKEARRIMD